MFATEATTLRCITTQKKHAGGTRTESYSSCVPTVYKNLFCLFLFSKTLQPFSSHHAGNTQNDKRNAQPLAHIERHALLKTYLIFLDKLHKEAEYEDGNPKVSEAYIKGLKALGFNAVRIPCAWDYYIVNPSTYEIDAVWLDRVSEVVGYCVANDMYAIVNIHWDGGWLEESITHGYSSEVDAKQKAIWTQIANKLNAYDEHLLFAGCNEPGQQDQGNVGTSAIDVILKYEQTFIDAVRATGGNNASRCLIVQGPYTNIDKTVNDYTMPKDEVPDRLMVEVHFYDPYQFTMMNHDETWSNVFLYWGKDNHVSGSIHNATGYEEDYVKQQFQKMKTAYADKGIPVIVGEYSAMKRAKEDKIEGTSELAYPDIDQEMHNKSRSYWNEVVTREAKNHGCVPFYWETGGDMNRGTGTAKEAYAIEGIMKGAAAGQYPY